MKKVIKGFLLVLLIMVGLLYGTQFVTKNSTNDTAYLLDMSNPFVKMETVYGQVTAKPVSSWTDNATRKKDYGYNIKTINAAGKTRTVQITSYGKKIEPAQAYVRVNIKGQYVRGFGIIARDDIPEKIRAQLATEP